MTTFGPSTKHDGGPLKYTYEFDVEMVGKGFPVVKGYFVKDGKRDKFPAFNGNFFQFKILMGEMLNWTKAIEHCENINQGRAQANPAPPKQHHSGFDPNDF